MVYTLEPREFLGQYKLTVISNSTSIKLKSLSPLEETRRLQKQQVFGHDKFRHSSMTMQLSWTLY